MCRKVRLRMVKRVAVVVGGIEGCAAGLERALDGHGRSHNISAECCVSSNGARVGMGCLPSRSKEAWMSEKGLS